jgi:inner membrane transporter RhtA
VSATEQAGRPAAAHDSTALPLAALLVTIVSVQFGASFAKRLFPVFGVELTTALRLCVGALLLLPVLRPWRRRLPARAWPAITLFGAVLAAMNLSFYLAIQRIPLGIAVALEFTGPLTLAALTSHRALHLVWVGLAALGVLLLLPLPHTSHTLDATGVLLALGAAGAWALYTVLGQRIGTAWGTPVIALSIAAGGLMLLPVALLTPHHFGFAPREVGDALMVGLFSSALPYPLELYALTRMSTRVYGTLTSLEPAVGALMGLLVLQELPTAIQLAGMAAVMAASVGTAVSGRRS